MPWHQIYDPFNNVTLSTLFAALPIVVLLGTLGILTNEGSLGRNPRSDYSLGGCHRVFQDASRLGTDFCRLMELLSVFFQ